jgi:hypothetical protein
VAPASAGAAFIVTPVVVLQPSANVKVIVADPADTGVTIPVPDPIVATEVLLLLHVLLPEASVNVEVDPVQIVVVPATAAGAAFTVATDVALHPVPVE